MGILELKRLIDEIESLGINSAPLIDFVETLYIAQDLPYERA